MRSILIIEDEKEIADTLGYAIHSEGMLSEWVDKGETALKQLTSGRFDLCILDVGLPDCSGFELLKTIRKSSDFNKDIPVLMLTARTEEIDRIVGLEIGADDYVAKPFSPREVVARIKAILKRVPNHNENIANSENLITPASTQISTQTAQTATKNTFHHDEQRCTIVYNNNALTLTKAEYTLMQAFLEQPSRVFSRRQLIERVWSNNHPSDERAIDTHIKTLRAKLRSHNPHTDFIMTHRGFGYSIEL